MATLIDKSIEVLQQTNDGNDLSSFHLGILEAAVNGFLNDGGVELFEAQIYQPVIGGHYEAPWFHGIENLRIDHVGYVYWKGEQIEHYSSPWATSEDGKESALKLAAICQEIESEGQEVNGLTVWNKF